MSLRTDLEILAIGLELDLIDVADVIAWADHYIAATDEPHPVVCEVAFKSKQACVYDVAGLLRNVRGDTEAKDVLRGVLQMAVDALDTTRRTPQDVAQAIFRLGTWHTWQGKLPFRPNCCNKLWWFNDAISDARDGFIHETVEELAAQFRGELVACIDELSNA